MVTASALEVEIRDALESVNDPHVPASLRAMGMLAGVETTADGDATIRLRIPCLSCPGLGMLRDDIQRALEPLLDVRSVAVVEDWSESWSRDLVAPETQVLMRTNGIQL